MNPSVIEFFWDPASPYTWLAATQIEALAARSKATISWRPFVLGKVFEATGNRAPATVAAKAKHLFKDLQRWAQLYEQPLNFPKVFPVNSIAALRMACAADASGDGGRFAMAAMRAYWVDGVDIGKPEALVTAMTAAGFDGAALLEASQQQEVKDRLRANTDEAIKRGAFGAPSFFVGNDMFWGNDRLVLLERFLSSEAR
ncbi:2-hydroxychromene-2-carboxylate isomerase [Nevskia sp.]|uniref:2-hydroxychromene-2-carboxylate isomerase n=1 Tax=Nevskia sp. TaxID=1929292 RepID=UPI0025F4297B|nr:2-hydroxychromene-2-carboxylate isomerase [Nevskia sp.]